MFGFVNGSLFHLIFFIYSNLILQFGVRSWMMLFFWFKDVENNCQCAQFSQGIPKIICNIYCMNRQNCTELYIIWLTVCFNLTVYTLINYVWNVTYLRLTLCLQSSNKSNFVTDWIFFCFMKREFVFSSILVLLLKALDFPLFKYLKDLER